MIAHVAHVEFEMKLPDDCTVELAVHMGALVVWLECPNDAIALTQLSDALRRVVVDVEAQKEALTHARR